MEATGTRWETARVEAFSDGVFAIAITLLVLEIGIDPAEFDAPVESARRRVAVLPRVRHELPDGGGVWLAHHRLYSHLSGRRPGADAAQPAVVMVVAFLPFPTGLLAEALTSRREAERVAVVVYGVTAAVIELLLASAVGALCGSPSGPTVEGGDAAAPPRRTAARSRVPSVRRGDLVGGRRDPAAPRRVRLLRRRRPRGARCPARKVDCRSTGDGNQLTTKWSPAAGRGAHRVRQRARRGRPGRVTQQPLTPSGCPARPPT